MAAARNLCPLGPSLEVGGGSNAPRHVLDHPIHVVDDTFKEVKAKSKEVCTKFPSDSELRSTVKASQNSFQPLSHD